MKEALKHAEQLKSGLIYAHDTAKNIYSKNENTINAVGKFFKGLRSKRQSDQHGNDERTSGNQKHSHTGNGPNHEKSNSVIIKFRCSKSSWNSESNSFEEKDFDSETPCPVDKTKERKSMKFNWDAKKWIPGHWIGGKWSRGYFIPGKWSQDASNEAPEASLGFLPPGKGPEGDVPSNFQNLLMRNEEGNSVGTRDISAPQNIFPRIEWRQINIRREILASSDKKKPFWPYKAIAKIWTGANPQIVISKPLRILGDGFAKVKLG